MTLATMLERTATGYRASTGGPVVLSADGPTAAGALRALQALVAARTGGRDRVAGVDPPAGGQFRDDPWFPEFLAACAENRRVMDAPLDQAG